MKTHFLGTYYVGILGILGIIAKFGIIGNLIRVHSLNILSYNHQL